MTRLERESVFELIALLLAIPGALAAVATLTLLLLKRRSRSTVRAFNTRSPQLDLENAQVLSDTETEDGLTAHRTAHWFQDQYTHLHREFTLERSQWAEETENLRHPSSIQEYNQ
ncbi:hypothetical protein P280DRAFT_512822 [Massarina eburnea CBS 473.64]|uniref:Uncharacterized protein n=1 Tax=Massarina eburnea CBS 473.64 TaxID=1395130 RepID=A0A6A6SGJ5_9PLEO|nr:hypothetical protein P280DRAFT_512822 [Massarina eburnea CBS 473.64]